MRFSVFSVVDHHPSLGGSVAARYAAAVDLCLLAEALGFDTFFVAEHHFHEYGVSPDPSVLLAHLAARTRRIRLGTAIAVLPFHHPATLAERYAMLDVLSGGRLVLGVGSGYLHHEFAGFAIPAEEKRARFDESLAVLRRLLAGERVTTNSPHHRLEAVALNVLPLQQPPPIYVAALRKEAAYYVGQGQPIIGVPYASVDRFAEIAPMLDDFRRGWSESGRPGKGEALLAFHSHVAPTDAAAREAVAECFARYVETRLYARRQTYDDILASELSLFGSPETVCARLQALAAIGVEHVLLLADFGALAAPVVHEGMRRFAAEVKSRFA